MLRRVRFAEEATPEGKQVWHQGEEAELVSRVDAGGRVYEQELGFRGAVVHWRTGEGVRTGSAQTDARGHRDAATLVQYHPSLQVNLLEDACELLEAVKGDDRYLGHMAKVLGRALEGIKASGTHTVTRPHAGESRPGAPLWKRLLGWWRRPS